MRSAATSVSNGENAALPVARIDAQDAPSVLPLREYLESNGVQVFVNKVPGMEVTYHIVMGDGRFVKQIYSRIHKTKEKRLAISVGHLDTEPDPKEYRCKIIFVDPKEISQNQVIDMFEFFFTSDREQLDLRVQANARTGHEKSVHPFIQGKEQIASIHHGLHNERQLQSVSVREQYARPISTSASHDQERIGSIIADVFGDAVRPEVQKHKERIRRRKVKQRQWGIGLLLGLGILIIPIFWYFLSISISGIALGASARGIASGNMSSVNWETQVATYWINQGRMTLSIVSIPLSWIRQQDTIRGQERLLSFFSDGASAAHNVQSMLSVGQSVAAGLLNQVDVTGTGTTSASDVAALRTSLDSVQNTLGLAQAEISLLLSDHTFPFSIPIIARGGTKIISELIAIRDSAANMDRLVSLFLHLAGFKEPKTYLILLQNSSELRPTGGFIGSIAVASFEDGRMTDLQVNDVYTFDGQLKGHVEPPAPIRELLGQEHWYLRDSNWDPDFAVSGAKAAWFYQKEAGTSVDGVFAINAPFIVDILKATGPIELTDYNDRITADNFYGKALYYTQNDFFPGSTQKKDFLGTLMRALITKITTSKTTNMTALFHAMTSALTGHDLLMMFGTPELESEVSHYGWAGIVPAASGCIAVEAGSCTFDPFIIVESNMGVNKANYFVTRTIDRQITVNAKGVVSETATVTLKNTGGQNQGQSYRDYVRFLLPTDVAVAGVTINGAPVPGRKDTTHPPAFPYVERTDVSSPFYVLGVGVDVVPASELQLAITYTRDGYVHFGADGAVVDLFSQKQPGVDATPVHIIIHYPVAWTAGLEEQASGEGGQDFIALPGQLEYNMVLDRDHLTRIRFTK